MKLMPPINTDPRSSTNPNFKEKSKTTNPKEDKGMRKVKCMNLKLKNKKKSTSKGKWP